MPAGSTRVHEDIKLKSQPWLPACNRTAFAIMGAKVEGLRRQRIMDVCAVAKGDGHKVSWRQHVCFHSQSRTLATPEHLCFGPLT